MTFTCDTCNGEYEPSPGNASARVYLSDAACNHIEVRCSHCGAIEVIYLRPRRFEDVVRRGRLRTAVHAEASDELRRRAARSWAEAEAEAQAEPHADNHAGDHADDHAGETGMPSLRTYRLTARHEVLLHSFRMTLENMPDDLLWEELEAEHDRRHPERWID